MVTSSECTSLAIQIRLSRLGMTQKDLSSKTGINAGQLSGYMNGKVDWSLKTLDRLAPALRWKTGMDIAEAARLEAEVQRQIACTEEKSDELDG